MLQLILSYSVCSDIKSRMKLQSVRAVCRLSSSLNHYLLLEIKGDIAGFYIS